MLVIVEYLLVYSLKSVAVKTNEPLGPKTTVAR